MRRCRRRGFVRLLGGLRVRTCLLVSSRRWVRFRLSGLRRLKLGTLVVGGMAVAEIAYSVTKIRFAVAG